MTTNLALPGFGSLLAGRIVGYVQILIALAGFALTSIFGIHFIVWYFANSARLQEIQIEPDLYFHEIWMALRWALLGMGMFLLSWLWALGSSLGILAKSRADAALNHPIPPRIKP